MHDFNKVGALLDGVTQNGANQIQNVQYTFNDLNALTEQARVQALSNARAQAQKLAEAAGIKLGKLITFTESSNGAGRPVPYLMMDKGLASPASVGGFGAGGAVAPVSQTEPGSQDFIENVDVVFELK